MYGVKNLTTIAEKPNYATTLFVILPIFMQPRERLFFVAARKISLRDTFDWRI
jgi:hypothetical protein